MDFFTGENGPVRLNVTPIFHRRLELQ